MLSAGNNGHPTVALGGALVGGAVVRSGSTGAPVADGDARRSPASSCGEHAPSSSAVANNAVVNRSIIEALWTFARGWAARPAPAAPLRATQTEASARTRCVTLRSTKNDRNGTAPEISTSSVVFAPHRLFTAKSRPARR